MHFTHDVLGARIGDYLIDQELSGTDNKTTYLGSHAVLPRTACVIVGGSALLREACILEAVRGPGVPRVYECGVLPDRRVWIAIERIVGPTIADAGGLSARDAATVLRDVAVILERAEANSVSHGRLSPRVIVRGPECWCVTSWSGKGDARDDLRALGAIVTDGMGLATGGLRLATLLEHVLAARLSARDIRHRAAQLLEAGELDDQIVQVEVELVDISRSLG